MHDVRRWLRLDARCRMLQATIGARDDKRSDEETAAGPDFTTHPVAFFCLK